MREIGGLQRTWEENVRPSLIHISDKVWKPGVCLCQPTLAGALNFCWGSPRYHSVNSLTQTGPEPVTQRLSGDCAS